MIAEYTPRKSRVLSDLGERFGGLIGSLNGLVSQDNIEIPRPDVYYFEYSGKRSFSDRYHKVSGNLVRKINM